MKSTPFSNVMTLLLVLLVAATVFLAGSANAACCNVGCMPRPCQPCEFFAVASCHPKPSCPASDCPHSPMDTIMKANTLGELLKTERAEKRSAEGAAAVRNVDSLYEERNVGEEAKTDPIEA